MSRVRATRRLAALTAVTSLLSAAGLASGAFVGVAGAAPSAGSLTPGAVSNAVTSATNFTLTGSGFTPNTATVTLHPTKPGDEVGDISGTVDTANSTDTTLKFSATLTLAAPEPYDVVVSQPALNLAGKETSTCPKCLTVTNPGRPTVTSVKGDSALGDGYLIITGTNFARGAKVEFLKPDLTVDPQLTFTAGKDTTNSTTMQTTHTTGYPSSTTLKGLYKVLDPN
ncbi:MAG: hypothetical protein JWO12_1170, partial [Frankiales bacterium]|nr:hypothetical protein [Frankiales bacterium]